MAKTKFGIFYHSTSADHLADILKNGLCPVPATQRIWKASYPDHVYLWGEDACRELDDRDARLIAMESAFFALARAKDCRIVLLRLKLKLDNVSPDMSAEGMADCGAFQHEGPIPAQQICGVEVSEDLSVLRPFFLRILLYHPNCNYQPTQLEQLAIQHLRDHFHELYELDDYCQFTTIDHKQRHPDLRAAI